MIKKHTDLKVKHYVGEMGVDLWNKNKWENEFNENNVLVMTAQIFLNLLHHGFIKLSQVNLLIFDECHHAKKSHPYKQIMNRFVGCQEADYPKIMGLTASVVNKKVKPGKIESEIQELECTLRSTCETSQDEDVGKFASKPNEQIIQFSNANFDDSTIILLQKLQEVLRPEINYLGDYEVQGNGVSLAAHSFALSALTECQEILSEMGPWAANKVAGYLIKDLQGKVTDPDLQIRGRGGGGSYPDPEIWEGWPVSKKGREGQALPLDRPLKVWSKWQGCQAVPSGPLVSLCCYFLSSFKPYCGFLQFLVSSSAALKCMMKSILKRILTIT